MISIIKKIRQSIVFSCLYLFDLTRGALRIGWDIVTFKHHSSPGVFWVPLEAKSNWEITIISNLITFSPGTMVVDISHDRKKILIHSMFLEDEEMAIREIKDNIEKRVLELLR